MRLAAITGDLGKPRLHMPTETLHPNKLAGNYIISIVTNLPRAQFHREDFTRFLITKIYKRGIYYYICPQIGEDLPEGYRWIHIGKLYRRDVYRAV